MGYNMVDFGTVWLDENRGDEHRNTIDLLILQELSRGKEIVQYGFIRINHGIMECEQV